MQRGFLILGLIQYFFLNVVFSQEKHSALNIETYSVEDGLSQSSVQNIFQDKFGYIWISTGDGLNCFDGDTFRRYYFNSLANASHQSNSMRHVANDGAGNLWIGTDHGLLFLDRADDELIQPFPEISDLINYPCIPLFCENDSVSVLVVNKGILNIHIRQHRFKRIPLDLKLADLSVYTSSENEKWFWFYPDNLVCISRIPGRGIHIKKYTHFFHPQDNFKGVLKMDEQKYLLATGTNLYLLHKNTGHTEPVNIHSSGFPDSYSGIIAMAADSGGRIWLATSCKGIIILNKDLSVNKKFKGLQKAGFEQNEFRNISILHGDGMGNLWFGSDGSGLGFYSPQSAEFGLIDKISLPDEDLNRLFVRCFLQDTLNQIWIGTYNKGLLCWDRRNDKFTRIWLSPETPFPSANDVYCLAPYTNGRILAGTATGLFIVDVMQKVSVAVKNLFPEGSIIRITDILQLPNGSFELLMNQKAFRLEPLNGNFLLNISPFPDSVFFDKLFQGKNNTLRAFTKEGFYLAHSGTAKFFEYDFNYQHVSLSVNALSEDDAGVLWLATNTGLIKMDAGGKIISFFDETAGFSNHHLYGILAGNGNNLWVSHNRGLSEFVKANEKVFNYQMEYGLQSLEFNSGAYYQTSDNEMFFGGISGFNYFFPDKINNQSNASKVFIHNVFVNEKPLLTDSCWMVKRSLDLAYS
ncbi:MAG: hypothetical protein K9H16_11735, partial [Bacteroidales bacterium]|nr:hypothetical protein [Bacteroidales bacterium]